MNGGEAHGLTKHHPTLAIGSGHGAAQVEQQVFETEFRQRLLPDPL